MHDDLAYRIVKITEWETVIYATFRYRYDCIMFWRQYYAHDTLQWYNVTEDKWLTFQP